MIQVWVLQEAHTCKVAGGIPRLTCIVQFRTRRDFEELHSSQLSLEKGTC